MDRLQFNGWHVDGWLTSVNNMINFRRRSQCEITFEIVEGNLTNGDGRIWFIPDVQSPLHEVEFQGYIQNLESNVDRQIVNHGDVQQSFGTRRTLNIQINSINYLGSPEFDPNYLNRNYAYIVNADHRLAPDPDIEQRLVQEQINKECKLAIEQQEQIYYKNFPSRLDSID